MCHHVATEYALTGACNSAGEQVGSRPDLRLSMATPIKGSAIAIVTQSEVQPAATIAGGIPTCIVEGSNEVGRGQE